MCYAVHILHCVKVYARHITAGNDVGDKTRAHPHDSDGMICFAEADNAMEDSLLHDVKVRLGRLQARIQLMFPLPFLHSITHSLQSHFLTEQLVTFMTQKVNRQNTVVRQTWKNDDRGVFASSTELCCPADLPSSGLGTVEQHRLLRVHSWTQH